MPFSHVGINTPNIELLHTFYTATLSTLGYVQKLSFKNDNVRGYGPKEPWGAPDFWLTQTNNGEDKGENATTGGATGFMHIAFSARTRNEVRAFYEAALASGGKCNGPPGPRPQYFLTYYAAFVLDPEGRNIEAVCMKPGMWGEEWSWIIYIGLVSAAGAGVAWCLDYF